MGLFSDNRIMYGGRAPTSWRVSAYVIVGVVLLIVASALGANGWTAGICFAGALLAVGAVEWVWGRRHPDTPIVDASDSSQKPGVRGPRK
jgi:hypothetical protein